MHDVSHQRADLFFDEIMEPHTMFFFQHLKDLPPYDLKIPKYRLYITINY